MGMYPGQSKQVAQLLAACITISVVGPPRVLATALLPILKHKFKGERLERRPLLRSIYRLVERGSLIQDPVTSEWKLSEKGLRRARSCILFDLTLPEAPSTWDGQWRMVSFDVPERSRYLRDLLRAKLQSLGFTYLQKSLWVYPYPCERQLRELARRLGLERDIVIAVVSALTPDGRLRRKYNLV